MVSLPFLLHYLQQLIHVHGAIAAVDALDKRQREGAVTYLDSDLPRAFILLDEKGKTRVRLSRISTSGLKIRLESGITEE